MAEALGAKPNSQPDYLEELKAARRQADTATLCGAQRRPQFLNEDVGAKVIARALELLKVRQFSSVIAERPSYITDLIVTGATSFELGRLAAASDDYRVSLCSAVESNHQ